MAEFFHEEEFLSFLNELPEDLFGSNAEKVISLDDICHPGYLGMPGTREPYPRMPVQVEDSAFTQAAAQETLSREMKKMPLPQFINNSSDNRTSKKIILNVAHKGSFINK